MSADLHVKLMVQAGSKKGCVLMLASWNQQTSLPKRKGPPKVAVFCAAPY